MHPLIIISILTCILECIAPIIIKYVISWMYAKSDSDFMLQAEMMDIKKEMNSISMVDEFAKYAKLQRKYKKLETEFKDKVNSRLSSRAKISLIAYYGFMAINFLLNIILLFMYRGVLVIEMSKGTLWFMDSVLSWPSSEGYGVSFLQWSIMTRLTTTVIKRKVLKR